MKIQLHGLLILFAIIALVLVSPISVLASGTKGAADIERISVEDARARVQAGEALFVCSYGDDKCKGKLLEGAMLRSEFENKLPSLTQGQEIIFYCG